MNEMQKNILNILIPLVRIQLAQDNTVDEKQLDEYIWDTINLLKYKPDEIEFDEIRKELHHRFIVKMKRGIAIVNEPDYKDWYSTFNIDSKLSYWDRYKRYLSSDELAFPENVIDSIDQSTTDIVNLLGKPSETSMFSRKGLVIGDVQSGKTANYISVINKAADAGYKVIILLTGTIEKLRQQTQSRVDKGFIGVDTSSLEQNEHNLVGVGLFNSNLEVGAFTSILKDFNKFILRSSNLPLNTLSSPVILVAKKNKTVLNSIAKWFEREKKDSVSNKINCSLLLIDDEADNASINTNSPETNPTSINNCIRNILGLFMRSSYIGYTATPYANVFIEPDTKESMEHGDLFPKDYIYVLEAPSNYIGAREIYSEDGKYKSMYREINDFELFLPLKHKKDYELPLDIPLSLKKAIISFLLANTIRDLRGDTNTHRSMLVNVSRFICIQNNLKDLINTFFSSLKNVIQNYILDSNYTKHPLLCLVEQTYNEEFIANGDFKEDEKVNWNLIRLQLFESIKTIKVESVNGGNASRLLDYTGYKNGLRLIAIGGLSLSRGLTLEGLCISYFYRNSIMYDTLMQMGRWFGYRSNYEDLCQVWMSEESYSWYQHISDATDELRSEIKRIYYSNQTPKDVGIKVRSSEGALIITAKNKMRSASDFVSDINLNANYLETVYFSNDNQVNTENVEQINKFLSILNDNGYKVADPNSELLYNQSTKQILNVDKKFIVGLLKHVNTHHMNYKFDANKIADLLEESDEDVLNHWDVAFARGKSLKSFSVLGEFIPVVGRTMMKFAGGALGFRKKRLGSPGVVTSGLTKGEHHQFKEFLKNKKLDVDYTEKTIPDELYFSLGFERRPLLIIYLVDSNFNNDTNGNQLLVGLALGIPQLKEPKGLNYSYKVNLRWAAENFGVDEELNVPDDMGEIDD